ncbi:squalene/phytoene synthase family protein [Methylophilaceae bacterium]|nr:squalene/phytoene synthase family protein [Methylophilaceae bacterium]MDA9635715.1 squalene/phytoene synthase family protein [Nitrosomonadales bacterium]
MNQYLTLRKAKVTKKHYENFPVATLLFPKAHRDAATILYSFARNADDIADEGELTRNERKELLKEIEININSIKHQKKIQTPFFRDLDKVINQYSLDVKLFERFMSAFKQDVEKKSYRNFNDLINYCNKAACPAGEMILSLFDSHNKKNVSYSNSLCQALALIGMTQDIYEDFLKGRVYIPLTEMKKFTLKESDIKTKSFNHNWKMFKISWLKRIELLLSKGRPLGENVTGRLKLQIKILIAGAELLATRLKKEDCDWFVNPPKISNFDWITLLVKTIINKK